MAALRQAACRSLFTPLKTHNVSRNLFTKASPIRRSPITAGIYATALVLSTGLFAVYYFDARSALHRYVIMPVLRQTLDAETSHKIAVKVLRSGLGPKDPVTDDEHLMFELWGHQISNPIGLAAGFDKDGEAIDGLFDLGFSWVEIGSITPKPQPGNPKPRVFRLPEDNAIINRYGFPSQGHATVFSRVRARLPKFLTGEETKASLRDGSLLAVNLGKNKESPADSIDDFVAGVRTFGPFSDVLVVNVSSPNTPGLRGLQSKASLEALLTGVTQARDSLPPSYLTSQRPRLVLKIAPDLDQSQIEDIANVIKNTGIDGVIVSNTTIQRPSHLLSASRTENGGLSGPPIKPYTLTALRTLRANLPPHIPIIGCGGISNGEDALEYARAGATMVQVYTSFGYDGVGTCRRIKDQIVETLQKEGTTWAEIVKKSVDEYSLREKLPEARDGQGTVNQLIEEAQHLNKLLDELGRKMDSVNDRTIVAAF
ncbi:Dihydroorotate dehydrogenase-domain-containing protein [Lentinula edodes]|uniref:Dihydroorotate dehydrogenase-domain-containing protein n=1 Tax=Lentinula edodes TaxID=5353 RepID=UPI001E8DC7BE|nr:Dihydroorotate dehydrogenase-domain-containing protein [Lentinula edodes]KAH7878954.1 Dihydroorotate dehydrogenase-domain-containing protein [Lentinula edodes]